MPQDGAEHALGRFLRSEHPKLRQLLDRSRVIRQARDHPWCAFCPASIHLYPKGAVRSNKVVGSGGQEKTSFQSSCAAPGMPGAQGGTEPFDEGGVDCPAPALRLLDKVEHIVQVTKRQSTLDSLSVRPFDEQYDGLCCLNRVGVG